MKSFRSQIPLARFFHSLLLLLFVNPSIAQKPTNKISDDSITKKWATACLNLELKPNFFVSKIHSQWQKKKPADAQYVKKVQDNFARLSYSGTAIFLFYKNKHYLITCRHVIIDTNSALKDRLFERMFLREDGSVAIETNKSDVDRTLNVRYIEGYLGAQPKRYILSDSLVDLAIIALDDIPQMGRQYVAALYDKGYRPISISDIDTSGRLTINSPIIAIGFPELSQLKDLKKNVDSSIHYWQSPFVTIPVVSKGKIKNVYKDAIDFTGDIFIHNGFSGGPVIKDNKLIGINKAYGGIRRKMQDSKIKYYIDESSYFIKASQIPKLLRELELRFPGNNNPYVIMKNYKDSLTMIISGGEIRVK